MNLASLVSEARREYDSHAWDQFTAADAAAVVARRAVQRREVMRGNELVLRDQLIRALLAPAPTSTQSATAAPAPVSPEEAFFASIPESAKDQARSALAAIGADSRLTDIRLIKPDRGGDWAVVAEVVGSEGGGVKFGTFARSEPYWTGYGRASSLEDAIQQQIAKAPERRREVEERAERLRQKELEKAARAVRIARQPIDDRLVAAVRRQHPDRVGTWSRADLSGLTPAKAFEQNPDLWVVVLGGETPNVMRGVDGNGDSWSYDTGRNIATFSAHLRPDWDALSAEDLTVIAERIERGEQP